MNIRDRIPAGPRYTRHFYGDREWLAFKQIHNARAYYSGPSNLIPFGVKIKFTLPK